MHMPLYWNGHISIHALREECDIKYQLYRPHLLLFQSTHSVRSATLPSFTTKSPI